MAFTTQSNTGSSWGTEFFLYSNSTTATYQTTDCVLECFLDLSAMAAGDSYRIRIYEKVNGGTAKVVHDITRSGAQAEALWRSGRITMTEGWEVSLICTAGTNTRAIPWSFRLQTSDTTDVSSLATLANQTTIIGYIDTEVAAIKAKTDNLPADPASASTIASSFSSLTTLVNALPSASAVATAVLAATIHTGWSLARGIRIIAAAAAGKRTGDTFRFVDDSGDAITGTADSDGNRTAATYGA